MKKFFKFLVLFLVLSIVPIVHAEELPREGVTYFLTYPDGREEVTESYEEAVNGKEILLYEGTTNDNGEVVLENWASEGQLRIIQMVPDGYTTNETELMVNLGVDNSSTFVDYRDLSNPVTGRTILFFIIIAGAVGTTIVLRKHKKILFMIPIILSVFALYHVSAENRNFVIVVKDGQGEKLQNVQVKVYAKPINIEASPAIKFDANGGNFLDESEIMYVRIPFNGCTLNDITSNSTTEYINYIAMNMSGVHREGYIPIDIDTTMILENGMVIPIQWEENSEAVLGTIYANGGYFDFYGKRLEKIHFTIGLPVALNPNILKREHYTVIGTDNNPECSNMHDEFNTPIPAGNNEQYNAFAPKVDSPLEVYICWRKEDADD